MIMLYPLILAIALQPQVTNQNRTQFYTTIYIVGFHYFFLLVPKPLIQLYPNAYVNHAWIQRHRVLTRTTPGQKKKSWRFHQISSLELLQEQQHSLAQRSHRNSCILFFLFHRKESLLFFHWIFICGSKAHGCWSIDSFGTFVVSPKPDSIVTSKPSKTLSKDSHLNHSFASISIVH